jgi:PAS domain-containing protein
MSAAALCDLVILGALVAAVGILISTPSGGRSTFSLGAKVFLIAACALYALVAVEDLVVGRLAASPFATIESSLELMFVPTLLVAEYSLLARQKILDARQADVDLVRQSDMMTRMVESTPAGTMVLDADGSISFANHAARLLLDLDRPDARSGGGAAAWTIKMDLNGTGVMLPVRDWSALVVPETLTDVNVVIEWPNGSRRRLSLNSAPTFASDGHLDGAVVSFVDKEPWRAVSR